MKYKAKNCKGCGHLSAGGCCMHAAHRGKYGLPWPERDTNGHIIMPDGKCPYKSTSERTSGDYVEGATRWRRRASKTFTPDGIRKSARRAVRVQCIETGIVYQSMMAAEDEIGVSHGSLSKVFSGKNKTCSGWHWRKIEKGSI